MIGVDAVLVKKNDEIMNFRHEIYRKRVLGLDYSLHFGLYNDDANKKSKNKFLVFCRKGAFYAMLKI